MGKGKLQKFAEMAQNPLVVECPNAWEGEPFALKGSWHEEFFHSAAPIVLELGCGRGEYTVGLGKAYPEKNFVGVDIKGARMWTGAREALQLDMTNVAFLRTHIEFIDSFFAQDEVAEIWLTFSDPQMKKPTKRLTSTYFLQRYRRFLSDGGIVHLKTDSNFLFTYTEEMLRANSLQPLFSTRDLYGGASICQWQDVARSIQTHYEEMWLERGIDIKYLCFRLPREGELVEPEVEIPFDEYRSYARTKRSGKSQGR